jgi:hypothetical protein
MNNISKVICLAIFGLLLGSCSDEYHSKEIGSCLEINISEQMNEFKKLNHYLVQEGHVKKDKPETYAELVRKMKYGGYKINPFYIFNDEATHVKLSEKHIFPAFYTCFKKTVNQHKLSNGTVFKLYEILNDMHQYETLDAPFDLRIIESMEGSDLKNENLESLVMYLVWRNLYIAYYKDRKDAPKSVINKEI